MATMLAVSQSPQWCGSCGVANMAGWLISMASASFDLGDGDALRGRDDAGGALRVAAGIPRCQHARAEVARGGETVLEQAAQNEAVGPDQIGVLEGVEQFGHAGSLLLGQRLQRQRAAGKIEQQARRRPHPSGGWMQDPAGGDAGVQVAVFEFQQAKRVRHAQGAEPYTCLSISAQTGLARYSIASSSRVNQNSISRM